MITRSIRNCNKSKDNAKVCDRVKIKTSDTINFDINDIDEINVPTKK